MIPLVAIVGPTASGKTELGIEVARRLNTEIVSVDSMQFYRGMEIGAAAPTPAEQARARHHFVSILDPGDEMSAGLYQRKARSLIAQWNGQGKPGLAVGGAGLYMSALVDGLFEGPGKHPGVRQRLRAEAREKGNAHLMERLRAVDPEYADTLSSENDMVRVVRALEVYECTGQPFSALHARHRQEAGPIEACWFGLAWEREALYDRINRRVERMIEAGWADEVRALLEAGHGPHIDRLKALGFREMAAHLRGEQSLEAAAAATQQHHRRYAKRQISWFRGDPRVNWLPVSGDTPVDALAESILRHIETRPAQAPERRVFGARSEKQCP